VLRQKGQLAPGNPGAGGPPRGGGAPSGQPPGGLPGGAPGGGAPRGGGGASAGSTESVTFTRWIYNRAGSKYGFVIDKQGRVIQIEAIGLQNGRVKTRAGLGFGATFAQIIKAYGTPDSYEIQGDNILMKYLQRRKIAFRLSRLGEKKPQVVTGVVVAAGKG
jgi:hypothetical protein